MATSLAPRSAPHPVHHRGALAGRRTPGNEGATLTKALRERDKIRRDGWMN